MYAYEDEVILIDFSENAEHLFDVVAEEDVVGAEIECYSGEYDELFVVFLVFLVEQTAEISFVF